MSLKVLDDDRPGFAILLFSGGLEQPSLSLSIRSLRENAFLGLDGKWQRTEHFFAAERIGDAAGGTEYRVGPEIVNHLLEHDQIVVADAGGSLKEETLWENAVPQMPRSTGVTGGGVVAGSIYRAPAVAVPTEASNPVARRPVEPPAPALAARVVAPAVEELPPTETTTLAAAPAEEDIVLPAPAAPVVSPPVQQSPAPGAVAAAFQHDKPPPSLAPRRLAPADATGPGAKELGLIGLLIILAAIATMWFSSLFTWEFAIVTRALPMFALAMVNIYAAVVLVLTGHSLRAYGDGRISAAGSVGVQRERWIGLAVSATDFVVLGVVAAIGLNDTHQSYDDRVIISLTMVGAVLFLFATFRLLAWRAATSADLSRDLLDPVAIALLTNGIFGFWMITMSGISNLISDWTGLTLLFQLPLWLAMVLIALVIFCGKRRFAPSALIAAICTVSAVAYIIDLWSYGSDQTFEYNLLDAIGIFLNIVVLAFILSAYRRGDATTAQRA